LRIDCADEPGVLATISTIFAKNNVSIKSALQKEQTSKGSEMVFITHIVKEESVRKAVEEINHLDTVYNMNSLIRVGV
jgi:homoserine dehydrogenase